MLRKRTEDSQASNIFNLNYETHGAEQTKKENWQHKLYSKTDVCLFREFANKSTAKRDNLYLESQKVQGCAYAHERA